MKFKTTKKKVEKYCSYCGKKCTIELIGAENVFIRQYIFGEIITFRLACEYNKSTGKRNQCRKYICPDWKETKWYKLSSPHSNFIIKEVI